MSKDYKDLLVALDIGTSKVVAIVAELKGEGHYEVIGLGQSESKGLKKGVVVNIEATVQSIQRALEEAELMADCKITNVFTGIAGSHIRSFNSSGMLSCERRTYGSPAARSFCSASSKRSGLRGTRIRKSPGWVCASS